MARQAEHTDENIIEAGNRILAAGGKVSGWRLREDLGGGKASRLETVWNAHIAAGPNASRPERPASTLPPRIAEAAAELRTQISGRVDELVLDTYRLVEDVIAGRYRDELEQLRSARIQFEEDGARAERAVEAAETERDTLRTLVSEARTETAEGLRRIAALEGQLGEVQAQARRDAAEATGEIGALKAQLATASSSLQTERLAAAEALAIARERANEVESLKTRLTEVSTALQAAQLAAAEAQALASERASEAERQRSAAAEARATQERLAAEAVAASAAHNTEYERAEGAERREAKAKAEAERMRASLDEARDRASRAEGARDAAIEELRRHQATTPGTEDTGAHDAQQPRRRKSGDKT